MSTYAGPTRLLHFGRSLCEGIGGNLSRPVSLYSLFHFTICTCVLMNREHRLDTSTENVPMRGKPRTPEETIFGLFSGGNEREDGGEMKRRNLGKIVVFDLIRTWSFKIKLAIDCADYSRLHGFLPSPYLKLATLGQR